MATSTEIITEDLQVAFRVFVTRTPPDRLNRAVRTLLVDYLAENHEFLPHDFNVMIDDLSRLFDLLDQITTETKDWHREEHQH
ncbi:hypothetical protein [Ohtaekwangia sp.]|uniref:hypothetical protein n=1 Tax=Ohtaekwangia sp. TaxID=2066019 RepID=UPI002F931A80